MIKIAHVPGRPGWYQAYRGSEPLCDPTDPIHAEAAAFNEADADEEIIDSDGESIR